MRKFALTLACLLPLLATAQEQGQIPGVTSLAPVERSIPASAVDADGAYLEYKAMWSPDGKNATELGRYLSASECIHRLEHAFASSAFDDAIHQYATQELVCVAVRKKA
ncbi:hypothetical protein [Paraburkholderia aromaticivorans]|uniref:hypothetical protein n=1 Tax=Paraburkholderia aromaticivorans TaxID=2026199 RepID=UPI0038BD8FD3